MALHNSKKFSEYRITKKKAKKNAVFVEQLQSQGAIILGKTHTVEFALGATGLNKYKGTPKNPWDEKIHRMPGGSSSGSAVAVASGLAAFAIGTDTGGSVRIPASLNGIVGLKTTKNRWPTDGIFPLSPTLDTPGPIARNVKDTKLIFENEDTKITAFKVDHFPVDPSYAFKIEYKDRSIVISGDTVSLEVMTEYSKGVDVLFHDALAKPLIQEMEKISEEIGNNIVSKVLFDIQDYHANTVEVADIARRAEVDLLVFYHLIPAPRNYISEQMFLRGVDEIFTNYHVSEDGTLVSLPAGSEEILIDLID